MKHSIETLFLVNNSSFYELALGVRKGKPRPAQKAYAHEVFSALKAGLDQDTPSIAMLQAETGIGKSHGYLVPAALLAATTGGRVIVSTHSIALQNQLMRDVVPGVLKMVEHETGKALMAARRIGRQNFINITRFEELVQTYSKGGSAPRVDLMQTILKTLKEDPEQATIPHILHWFEHEISEIGLPFSLELCRLGAEKHEGYEAMVAKAAGADILVINHALLLRNVLFGDAILSMGKDVDTPVFLIVDEADGLPEVAKSITSRRVPMNELISIVKRSKAAKLPGVKAFTEAVSALAGSIETSRDVLARDVRLGGFNAAEIIPITTATDKQWLAGFMQALQLVDAKLSSSAFDKVNDSSFIELVASCHGDLKAYLKAIEAVAGGDNPSSFPLLYWTPVRQFPGLMLGGGDPGSLVSSLWRNPKYAPTSLILTSATLQSEVASDREDFLGFMNLIGMRGESVREEVIKGRFAPTNFGSVDFIVTDQRKTPPVTVFTDDDDDASVMTNPEIFPWWAEMVRSAAREDNGAVMVLTSSYKDAHLLQEAVGEIPGWQVLLDKRGSNVELAAFQANPRSVLITPSRWAGLDLPGIIRHLVVTRIPFAPPDQVYNAAIEAYYESAGRSHKQIRDMRFPGRLEQARRKLLQGFGRPIRSATDHATIWIGDKRWPMSRANKASWIGYVQRTWSGSMVRAVPSRFRNKLEDALVFSLDEGITPPGLGADMKARQTKNEEVGLV